MSLFSKNDKKVKEITETYEKLLNDYNELELKYDAIVEENKRLQTFITSIKKSIEMLILNDNH